ncbi:MAG: Do family serine endopeptidase [Bryobacterales bacterium]|nr:Do family serine endopeptidase [Bryobacterales bacterium]MDE0622615.1 Do family serine endopeptidase [Bryobacterales bacterium]
MRTVIERLQHSGLLPVALIFGTLTAGILIGTIISGSVDAAPESKEPVSDAAPLEVPAAEPVANQFSELAQQVRPSVVSIYIPASRADEEDDSSGPFNSPEDMFRRFFGIPEGPMPAPRRRGSGQGSGVIVDPKGYIITNHHVVADADRIRVSFVDDDERYDATLIGADAETDLAVIHVKGKTGLQAAKIGNSDAANVGDWAIAIGSPFGYRETVTVGIISALSREMNAARGGRPFQKFLQTDAAINPGNSGGPLLNIRGEVIGINTAIISRTGGYDGIGFALASNIAVKTYNQIVRFGRVSRGSIGVEFSGDQSPSLSRSYGAEGGVFVLRTVEDGPAEQAGMRAEDIIVSVGGEKIDTGEKLIEVVAAIAVGETVPIEVVRNGKALTLDVTIQDRAKLYAEQSESAADPSEAEEAAVRFGLTVQEIDPERRDQMRLSTRGGVLITQIEAHSFAEDIGLQQRDVVLEVNREPIDSIRDLRDVQRSLKPGSDVAFKLLRWDGRAWRTMYEAGLIPN